MLTHGRNAAALVLGKQYAAFQLFLRCPTNVVCKLPASISFEQGAVLPLAINTAGQALFGSGRLELPLPSLTPTPTNDAVFIYSGSSSVGSTAIQLAKAAGCYVITTASEHNFQFCKDVGADQVFDYKGSSWMDDTVEALKGKNFKGAFDTISTETTAKATIELLRRAGHDSQLMMVQPPSEDIDGDFIWAMAILKQNDLARTLWINFLPKALESGKVLPKPDPIVIGKGLEELQKGLDAQRNGVSARKVVVVL